jgi:phospholipase C
MSLADIDTIVIVIMENRSFDHMLGYLALPGPGHLPVEGVSDDPAWRGKYANFTSKPAEPPVEPHPLGADVSGEPDLPHNWDPVSHQINTTTAGGVPMGGFVQAYESAWPGKPINRALPMGYYDARTVPTYDFLAHNYLVCDHWFAGLPTSTQPNKLVAMGGESGIADGHGIQIPNQRLVYNWLNDNHVEWRVFTYGEFVPFFALMPAWRGEVLQGVFTGTGPFRRYDNGNFERHWTSHEPNPPKVVFIEPEYTESRMSPCDDHPGTGVAPGQALLHDVYRVLTSNPQRWSRTMLIITYDEHGGFFDHVPPLPLPAPVTVEGHTFTTTGPRVPAIIVSPQVEKGVFSSPQDHTSILRLLAEKWGEGIPFSDAVEERQQNYPVKLSSLLTKPPNTQAAPIPASLTTHVTALAAAIRPQALDDSPPGEMALSFRDALERAQVEHPELAANPKLQAMLARMK